MPEFFELSIICKARVEPAIWEEAFSLRLDHIRLDQNSYNGKLTFFSSKEVIFQEYNCHGVWVYELSVDIAGLFLRDNIVDKILSLLSDVNEITKYCNFAYAIGNIETNDTFIRSNKNSLDPSNEMILHSSLIFVPESKLKTISINVNHLIFRNGMVVCLFNPKSVLFSSLSEKYTILPESF